MSEPRKTVDLPFIGYVSRRAWYSFVAVLVLLVLAGIVRVSVFTYVEVHEFAYTFDAITGEAKPIEDNGYIATPPFLVRVYTIDKRPVQVCITANAGGASSSERTLNCKLVRFNPEGFETWLEYQGSGSYSGDALKTTLKAYAYEDAGRDYSFLEEIIDMQANKPKPAPSSEVKPTSPPEKDDETGL